MSVVWRPQAIPNSKSRYTRTRIQSCWKELCRRKLPTRLPTWNMIVFVLFLSVKMEYSLHNNWVGKMIYVPKRHQLLLYNVAPDIRSSILFVLWRHASRLRTWCMRLKNASEVIISETRSALKSLHFWHEKPNKLHRFETVRLTLLL